MSVEYLKRAEHTATTGEADVRATVEQMLAEIEAGGEAKAAEYARSLDRWDGEILVTAEDRAAAVAKVPQRLKDDIAFAHDHVRRFAEAQRAAILDTEVELSPGLIAGHRNIPVATAGCYVPGGRYTHLASAIMSVTTARVAGVENVIACSLPRPDVGINPAVLYAFDLCGADTVLALGGVQGVAALAFGLFTGHPADILVGPGNQYVAEAKRILYGRVGIDMFAGPSEILIIADDTADPEIVAADLVGQAEHGYNSPAWLIALSRGLADRVMTLVPKLIAELPEVNRKNAAAAWDAYGEVVLAGSREEAVKVSDDYASEHLEVHCADLDWWLRIVAQLRLALPRRGDHRRLWRQDLGAEPHPADQGRGALHGRALGRKIPEDGHMAAHDARGQPRHRRGRRADIPPGGDGGPRPHQRRPSRQMVSAREFRSLRVRIETPHLSAYLTDLFSLDGRVALVTGASSGIGRQMAATLARAGAQVVCVARRDDALAELVAEIVGTGGKATARACDLAAPGAAEALGEAAAERFGPPDILVNAAGINLREPAEQVTEESWNRTLQLNLTVPFFLARALVPGMRRKGGGAILNIASLQSYRAFANSAPYGASKGGVAQLTRAMAEAWSRDGIRANAILPGFFPTELTAPVYDDPALLARNAAATAIGRNGELADLDGITIFLASRASAYITGQIIGVDGGYLAK